MLVGGFNPFQTYLSKGYIISSLVGVTINHVTTLVVYNHKRNGGFDFQSWNLGDFLRILSSSIRPQMAKLGFGVGSCEAKLSKMIGKPGIEYPQTNDLISLCKQINIYI